MAISAIRPQRVNPDSVRDSRWVALRVVGIWVMGEGTALIGDVTVTAVFTLGYDPHREKFVGIWFDSVFTHHWIYEGELDDAGEGLSLQCEGPSKVDPNVQAHYREVISFEGDDRRMHESYVSTDGVTWTRMVAGPSRRR